MSDANETRMAASRPPFGQTLENPISENHAPENQASDNREDRDAEQMAASADSDEPQGGDDRDPADDDERDDELAENLKEFGIDTDRMSEAAHERVGDLQQMLIDEVRARPLRALGWAAAAGLVLGLMSAR